MTTGIPKQPTISSIVIGIALVIVAFLAFLRLPDLVKYTGAAFMYVPAKLGLIEMVMPEDLIPLPLVENPSSVTIPSAGRYLLYLDNYDLLVIHDAIVASNSKPWIKIQPENNDAEIAITLVSRGLAWYDTPFAAGRPVVGFIIDQPGTYRIVHPTRTDIGYIVPDTISGKESLIAFWALVQLFLLGGAGYFTVRKRTAARRQQRLNFRAQNRARVEEQRKKISKRAEEKRKDEDQPYWKKR